MENSQTEKPRKQWKWKRIRNRIIMAIVSYTLPYIYLLYIRFVWWTSKIIDKTDTPWNLMHHTDPYKFVAVLWHQDVFCVPWAYRRFQPVTMASVGDAGEIISRILAMCGYRRIWRGGSSKGKKRHKKILDDFIQDFREIKHSVAGITVDGSSGPPYRLKHGAIIIARECKSPIFAMRIWCKRRILLPTWDRTTIPLPFNKIVIYGHGPYYLPQNLEDENLEKFRLYIENELLELTYRLFMRMDGKVPPQCQKFFPPGWIPQWPEDNGVEIE